MVEMLEDPEQKREQYLQLINKARQINDQVLIKLILKKMVQMGMTGAVSTPSGCMIIPFPLVDNRTALAEDEPLTWWLILKLTLAIPGSLAALFIMALYSL